MRLKFRINFVDIDGCLGGPSPFTNIENNNVVCMTPEFLKKLRTLPYYEWWDYNTFDGEIVILVTGRLPDHQQVSVEWFAKRAGTWTIGPHEIAYVSTPWDDSKPSKEESYAAYVVSKASKLADLTSRWRRTLEASHIPADIRMYEDDKNVLNKVVMWLAYEPMGLQGVQMYLVDKETHKPADYLKSISVNRHE